MIPRKLNRLFKDGLRTRWRKYRKAMRECRRHASPTCVHKLRVETRRLLSLLSLLEPLLPSRPTAALMEDLRSVFKVSGRLRDTHVQRVYLTRHAARFPAVKRFDDCLARRERRRSRRLRRALAEVDASDLKDHLRRLRKTLDKKFADKASEAQLALLLRRVQETYMQVLRRKAALSRKHPESIHKLRIDFKKFRYMVEALEMVLPHVTPVTLSAMVQYQRSMGNIQDVTVLLETLEKLGRKHRIPWDALRARENRRRDHLVQSFFKRADRVETFWPTSRLPVRRTPQKS